MKVRLWLLTTVSSLALTAGGNAADLPVKASVYSPVPAAYWTGAYVGLNGGFVTHEYSINDLDGYFSGFPATIVSSSKTGGTFGAQIGYNFQDGSFVYGVEGDINWVGVSKSSTVNPIIGPFPGSYRTKVDWLATLRGRAGLAIDRTLLYVTGGVAFAHVNNGWGGVYAPPASDFSSSTTRFGWVAGVGVEHFFTPNWSAKAEALYVDLGTKTVTEPYTGLGYRSEFKDHLLVGRLGINYKW